LNTHYFFFIVPCDVPRYADPPVFRSSSPNRKKWSPEFGCSCRCWHCVCYLTVSSLRRRECSWRLVERPILVWATYSPGRGLWSIRCACVCVC